MVNQSDLLVHVVDSAAAHPEGQIEAVRTVLAEIGAGEVPELLAFNKADVTPEAKRLVDRYPGSVTVSALTGEGVDQLLEAIGDRLRVLARVLELVVPYERGDVLAAIHREGEVLVERHHADVAELRVRVDEAARPVSASGSQSPTPTRTRTRTNDLFRVARPVVGVSRTVAGDRAIPGLRPADLSL